MENSAKFNILKYAPGKLTVEIMMKYPPKDIIDLCKSKDRRVRELCKDFLSRKDYQKRWGGVPYHETYKKEDLEKLEKDVNVIEPNLEILITNLKGQPKDIQKMILLETDPETLLALCSIKDKAVQRVCSDKDFLEKYSNLHKKKLEELLMSFSKEGKYKELSDLLTIFGKYVDPTAGNYAIVLAVEYGHLEVVKLLLEDDRVDPSASNNYPIRKAAANGHTEIVKLLLKDKRVDPSDVDNYAIGMAALYGHTEIVELLLKDKRVDPSDDDNYAIVLAVEYGHTEIVKLLLEDRRVDPSDDDNYAIRKAVENGHTEIVKLLLKDKRVDPSDVDNYAIGIAALYGHAEIVELLKKHKK